MLKFFKEVWCNDNDEQHNYLLQWFSNTLKGNKNQAIIYAKAIEGIGKSTFIDFFVQYVLGKEFYAKGDKECIVSSFNMSLMGKLFVVFEDLPVMNKNEWNMCDSKLKDMATGTEMAFADKNVKRVQAANINNYVIITNHKAIKRPDGRRYYVVDLNTKYCNNHKYFANLRETCFNEKVGYAFYNYLMEMDTDDFNSLVMPDTQAKLDMVADLLSPIEKFLKQEFLLPSRDIKLKIKELYSRYEKYCDDNDLRAETPAEFRSGMKQYEFDFKTISGYNCYRITVDQLKTVATKRKWLHDLDKDFADEDDEPLDVDNEDNDKAVDMTVEYKKLKAKYDALLKLQKKTSDSDSDSDSEDEEPIARKVPA
jgi:hypothetical protein